MSDLVENPENWFSHNEAHILQEPISKQLEILIERRRQEEVRKARHNWSLLRNSIRNTVQAVREADIKSVVISHGIHHLRKLNHETKLKQVMFIKELNVSIPAYQQKK